MGWKESTLLVMLFIILTSWQIGEADIKQQEQRLTVDQIEEHLAVMLDRDDEDKRLYMPLDNLPQDVQEGDILNNYLELKPTETEEQKKEIEKIIENLLSDDKKQGIDHD